MVRHEDVSPESESVPVFCIDNCACEELAVFWLCKKRAIAIAGKSQFMGVPGYVETFSFVHWVMVDAIQVQTKFEPATPLHGVFYYRVRLFSHLSFLA